MTKATELDLDALFTQILNLRHLAELLDGRPKLEEIEGSGLFIKSLNTTARTIPVMEKMLQTMIIDASNALEKIYDAQKKLERTTTKLLK